MSVYKNLMNVGINHTTSTNEKKKIGVLNLTTYIALFHAVFFLLLDSVLGTINYLTFFTLSLEFVIFGLILFLHYKGFFKLARVLFILSVFSMLFFHCNYAFKGYYGEYQYLILPFFTVFFFDKRYIHYIALLVALLAFYIPNIYLKIYPDKYFGYANVALLMIGLFAIVNYFKKMSLKNEDLFKMGKESAELDKEMLKKQQKELKELNEFKSRFFTNLSHEIRTPLTLIQGYSNQLTEMDFPKKVKEKIEIINEQTYQMHSIVDNIMNLKHLDEGKLNLRTSLFDIQVLIKKQCDTFLPLFIDANIGFELINELDKNYRVPVDLNFFTNAFDNLLTNTLKFTAENGKVMVRLFLENENIKIEVVDNGIGINKDEIPFVFDRFYQTDNTISKSQGSGVGLAFTKEILTEHKFKISVESIPSQKTVFSILIPSSSITIQKEEVVMVKKDLKNAKRILLVEDNKVMRNYLKDVLKNFNITEAEDGIVGLKKLENNDYDLIITDQMMPNMDGLKMI